MEIKMSISTDKQMYRSKQTANITLSIDSPGEIKNVTAKVRGIYAKRKYYLNKAETLNLSAGENIKNMIYNMPMKITNQKYIQM